jgi:predicted nucleotidyltransferase
MAVHPDILQLAQAMAQEMAVRGAVAALLGGSHARGEAHSESDIDLTFIGRDATGWLERRAGHLVSIDWRSPESIRTDLRNPAAAGWLVPALRNARILHDPQDVAAGLKREAEAWTWDSLSRECDAWVAGEITGYAEEVHRLAGSLGRGNWSMAAVVRAVLAIHLAPVLSVHLRLFYNTENELWDGVSQALGEPWAGVQAAALGIGNESFAATCAAALQLYTLGAAEVRSLLDERQSAVVEHACELADHCIDR